MSLPPPDLRRTWLFGPGADAPMHAAMLSSRADALIFDLEDFTPAARRGAARALLPDLMTQCRARKAIAAVRINALDGDGLEDLAAAMAARPDVIAYPMTESGAQIVALDALISRWEAELGVPAGQVEILPVCETALGVVEVRAIGAASARVQCALLGAEDLAADLCAERGADAIELDHARRRFVLECRAAGIEPVDAPYTFSDADGAVREAHYARRLGYRSKSLVRPEHAAALNGALTPDAQSLQGARTLVTAFEAGRARGEDRVLVGGLWVEVPAYRNAQRLIERAQRLASLERSGDEAVG